VTLRDDDIAYKRYRFSEAGIRRSTDDRTAQCVEACVACARECDAAAGRLVERGERRTVDALIACTATARLVADLLGEDADIDRGVLDLCVAACERCVELGIDSVGGECAEAARCLRALF
jgi:hypothetical protein